MTPIVFDNPLEAVNAKDIESYNSLIFVRDGKTVGVVGGFEKSKDGGKNMYRINWADGQVWHKFSNSLTDMLYELRDLTKFYVI